MKKILIIGTGGLAREFTTWFENDYEIVGYSSIEPTEHSKYSLPGVLYAEEVTPSLVGTNLAVLAIGTPARKNYIIEQLSSSDFLFPTIIHHSSEVSARVSLGDGVIVSPNCVISTNVTIKEYTYVNFSCGIGHDTTIGSCVQINPGTQLGGFSKIGDQVLIGSGSTILPGVVVGNNATIAAGAVVFAKVPEGVTVLGNPAKRMHLFEKRS